MFGSVRVDGDFRGDVAARKHRLRPWRRLTLPRPGRVNEGVRLARQAD